MGTHPNEKFHNGHDCMNLRYLFLATVALVLSVVMISCSGRQDEVSDLPAASLGGRPVDLATAGAVSGKIILAGSPPTMRVINMAAVPNCAKGHPSPAMTEDVVPGENGTLQNVVVYLKGDFSQYSFETAESPVNLDQKGCTYIPHVLALRVGQSLRVTNSDPATHNIHTISKINRPRNDSQSSGAVPIKQTFARQEVAIAVKCNVHPWMKAYIAVLSTPYFQVTGKDGSFEINNVPPGTYTVTAWHELYGISQQSMTIGPKESKALTITFKATASH
jgi:plastocyanin